MAIIEVKNLVKEFKVVNKKPGISGAVKGLFKRDIKKVRAVDDISFEIEKGEIVGYIGPNGAGKSTTIKMMSGILHPTSGDIHINGLNPQKQRKTVVQNLGVVFGQRTQLYWDLRLGESFELMRRIYRIEKQSYNEKFGVLSEILGLKDFVNVPVRQLSLGQRMRGDLAASMLHSPGILFLDEPTIGLDVDVKHSIRKFIKDINKTFNTTIILTTHDLSDIQELCSRLIIINKGKIVEDGPLDNLINKIAPLRRLTVEFYEETQNVSLENAITLENKGNTAILEFNRKNVSAPELIDRLFKKYHVKDISLQEADIEDVIKTVYKNT